MTPVKIKKDLDIWDGHVSTQIYTFENEVGVWKMSFKTSGIASSMIAWQLDGSLRNWDKVKLLVTENSTWK